MGLTECYYNKLSLVSLSYIQNIIIFVNVNRKFLNSIS